MSWAGCKPGPGLRRNGVQKTGVTVSGQASLLPSRPAAISSPLKAMDSSTGEATFLVLDTRFYIVLAVLKLTI